MCQFVCLTSALCHTAATTPEFLMTARDLYGRMLADLKWVSRDRRRSRLHKLPSNGVPPSRPGAAGRMRPPCGNTTGCRILFPHGITVSWPVTYRETCHPNQHLLVSDSASWVVYWSIVSVVATKS